MLCVLGFVGVVCFAVMMAVCVFSLCYMCCVLSVVLCGVCCVIYCVFGSCCLRCCVLYCVDCAECLFGSWLFMEHVLGDSLWCVMCLWWCVFGCLVWGVLLVLSVSLCLVSDVCFVPAEFLGGCAGFTLVDSVLCPLCCVCLGRCLLCFPFVCCAWFHVVYLFCVLIAVVLSMLCCILCVLSGVLLVLVVVCCAFCVPVVF